MNAAGKLVAICTSERKGTAKQAVQSGLLVRGLGLMGDAHAGSWHRQISLIEQERTISLGARGLALVPGMFGENLLTRGIALRGLVVGSRLRVGNDAILQITQRGKECHSRCAIYEKVGDCIMPREGLFARVRRGGVIRTGDTLAHAPELDGVRWAACTLFSGLPGDTLRPSPPALAFAMLENFFEQGPTWRSTLPEGPDAGTGELIRLCEDEVCDLVVVTGGAGAGAGPVDALFPSGILLGRQGEAMLLDLRGDAAAVRDRLAAATPVLAHTFPIAGRALGGGSAPIAFGHA